MQRRPIIGIRRRTRMPRPGELALLSSYCWLTCAVALLLIPTPWTHAADDDASRYGQNCSFLETDNKCGPNERCVAESTGTGTRCVCLQGYEYAGGECRKVPATETPTSSTTTPEPDHRDDASSSGGGSIAAILLTPICLATLGALVYVGARRYKWIQRFRQFRQNRYGSVLVTRDDTDDDDQPPLA